MAAARATQKRTVLRAPFAGVVARITGEVGEFTTPSPPGIPTPPAVDLIDDSCLYVTAPIDEVDVARVRVGQRASITIDAIPGRRFPGRVRRVAPYVVDFEKQARTVDVEMEFLNPEDVKALLVGYSADAEIILDVPRYDFNWQTYYMFTNPIDMPAGSRIVSTAWYDNSKGNKDNPDPSKEVRWGDQTWEEMQYTGFLYSIPARRLRP